MVHASKITYGNRLRPLVSGVKGGVSEQDTCTFNRRACSVPLSRGLGVVSVRTTDNTTGTPFFVPGVIHPKSYGGNTMQRTAPHDCAAVRKNQFINASHAEEQLYRIAAKLTFIQESNPLIHTDCEYSRLGLEGLSFVLRSVMDDIQEAGECLERIQKSNMEGK